MKKSNFIEGAFIATAGIVICKIIGLLYVIPFYKMVGSQGGALYSYAYSIYAIFLSLSSAGIPVAMSKIVSEYNSLGYNKTKNLAIKIGLLIIGCLGLISFLMLFVFADNIAYLIIGDITGGNSRASVALAIRIISFALLFVPFLSVSKGYLQGHKIMTASSVSNILEQVIRVIVIVGGSYLVLNQFNLSVDIAVFVALLGATAGAACSLLYITSQIKKHRKEFVATEIKEEEKLITVKDIVKKIVYYALPFVIIDIVRSGYGIVDSLTVVKTMVGLGYDIKVAESSIGVISTWGTKLNMIIASISIGITTSLIPNLVNSFTKGDMKEVNNKINQSTQILLAIVLPMTFGLSFLGQPVWNVFYGYDALCVKIIRVYVLQAIIYCTYTLALNTAQSLNNSKIALSGLFGSFLFKALLNIPIMHFMCYIGSEAYYGPIISNILIEGTASIIMFYLLKKKYNFSYKSTFKAIGKMIIALVCMFIVLFGMNFILPVNVTTRSMSLIIITVYAIVGALVYFFVSYKIGLIKDVLGNDFFSGIIKKFSHKKQNI